MLYDTHAHLNLAAFNSDFSDVISHAESAGVIINNVGTQKATSEKAVELAEKYSNMYAIVGLHPSHVVEKGLDEQEGVFATPEDSFDNAYYFKLANNPKVVGIGECGLDYYRIPEGMSKSEVRDAQKKVFLDQLDLALQLDKVLVIHCRASKDLFDAYDDILEILSERQHRPQFEIHSFTANWEYCQKFLKLGGYIGLNAIITFDKTGSLLEVVQNCPLEKIVLETDAPYLAPAPFRGKRNEPHYIEYVARYIAEKRNLSFEQISDITTENAKKLFKI